MRNIWKTIGLLTLILCGYILFTSGVSLLVCVLCGIAFDFFVSLSVWFFISFAVMCAILCYQGGASSGRELENDW